VEFFNNLRIIRKHIWLVLLTTLVAGGSAAVVDRLHYARTIYTSSAQMILDPNVINRALLTGNLALLSQNRTGPLDIDTLAATYGAYIDSPGFTQRVITQDHLARTAADLTASITTNRLPNTIIFEIRVTGYDAVETARDADALRAAFIQDDTQYIVNPGGLNQGFTAASSSFYSQLIAQLQSRLATVFQDPRLTLNDKYAQAIPLQNQLNDAQGAEAKLTPPVDSPAASAIGDVPPQPLVRTALVANIVLFALLGGFIVGLALALLREYLDYSLRDADEATETLGVPVLATIGLFPGRPGGPRLSGSPMTARSLALAAQAALRAGRGRSLGALGDRGDSLVTLSRPFDAVSEAFRNLRTGIIFAGAVTKVRTIVVTSALPGEGKSVVAANVAIVMAQAGERVILVDANMRAPVQHTFFGLPNASGLSTLYLGEKETLPATVLSMLRPTPIPNLRLLDAGQIAPNPAELLASVRTGDIVATLAAQADFVIFDTPAMGLLTDAVILASHVDGTAMVASARTTRRDRVKAALDRLDSVHARGLGVVLNKADVLGARSVRYYRGARRAPAGTPGGRAGVAAVSSAAAATAASSRSDSPPLPPR